MENLNQLLSIERVNAITLPLRRRIYYFESTSDSSFHTPFAELLSLHSNPKMTMSRHLDSHRSTRYDQHYATTAGYSCFPPAQSVVSKLPSIIKSP